MGRMPRLVERGKKDRRLGEPREVSWEEIEALELDPRVELIRQLIPLGLAEVGRMLEEGVEQLAGQRHARKTEDDRHYRDSHQHQRSDVARAVVRLRDTHGCDAHHQRRQPGRVAGRQKWYFRLTETAWYPMPPNSR